MMLNEDISLRRHLYPDEIVLTVGPESLSVFATTRKKYSGGKKIQAMQSMWLCLVPLSMWLHGCSQELARCDSITDSSNQNNQLRLIPNSHDKTYSAILVCGSSNPVLVGKFSQCLSGEEGQATSKTFFAYCSGSVPVTQIPSNNNPGGTSKPVQDSTSTKPTITQTQRATRAHGPQTAPAVTQTTDEPTRAPAVPVETTAAPQPVVEAETAASGAQPVTLRRRPATH